jgi:hypothetical protein
VAHCNTTRQIAVFISSVELMTPTNKVAVRLANIACLGMARASLTVYDCGVLPHDEWCEKHRTVRPIKPSIIEANKLNLN